MDNALEEKISSILSSPEDLKKIMELASNLGLAGNSQTTPETKESATGEIKSEASSLENLLRNGKSERLELLSALKPYLKDGKRDKIDSLLKLINTAEILLSAKKFL